GGDSPRCDADCTETSCGDGYVNTFVEQCEPARDVVGGAESGADFVDRVVYIAQTMSFAQDTHLAGLDVLMGSGGCDATAGFIPWDVDGAPGVDLADAVVTFPIAHTGIDSVVHVDLDATLAAGAYALVFETEGTFGCGFGFNSDAYAGGDAWSGDDALTLLDATSPRDLVLTLDVDENWFCYESCVLPACGDGVVNRDEACEVTRYAFDNTVPAAATTPADEYLHVQEVVLPAGADIDEIRVRVDDASDSCPNLRFALGSLPEGGGPPAYSAQYLVSDAFNGDVVIEDSGAFYALAHVGEPVHLDAGTWAVYVVGSSDPTCSLVYADAPSGYRTWFSSALDVEPGEVAGQDIQVKLYASSLVPTATCDADCTTPECGDGVLNEPAGEACEPALDPACTAACELAVCGDGVVQANEACEPSIDGAAACDPDCTAVVCGDGLLNTDAGEVCEPTGAEHEVLDGLQGESGEIHAPDLRYRSDGDVGYGETFALTRDAARVDATFLVDGDCDGGIAYLVPAGDDDAPATSSTLVIEGDVAYDTATSTIVAGFDGAVPAGHWTVVLLTPPDTACDILATSMAGIETTGAWSYDFTSGGLTALGGDLAVTIDATGSVADCDLDCSAPSCGDGVVNFASGEGCDMAAGLVPPGSGCTSCVVDSGYRCLGSPSTCERTCGNGALDAGEQCDPLLDGGAACDFDCTLPVCGDGVLNTNAGEGCEPVLAAFPTLDVASSVATSVSLPLDGVDVAQTFRLDEGALLTSVALEMDGDPDDCDFTVAVMPVGSASGAPGYGEAIDTARLEPLVAGETTSTATWSRPVALAPGDWAVVVFGQEGSSCVVRATATDAYPGGSAFIGFLGFTDHGASELPGDLAARLSFAAPSDELCNADCTVATCGDGTVSFLTGEECDDGRNDDGDGCSADCHLEDGFWCGGAPTLCEGSCRNFTLDVGEECDSTPGCRADCTLPVCGDGEVGEPLELCDDGGDSATCTASCEPTVCGDGVTNAAAGEACDGGSAALVTIFDAPTASHGLADRPAQSFLLAQAASVGSVDVLLRGGADACAGAVVSLVGANSGGLPSETPITSGTVGAAPLGERAEWVRVAFSAPVDLTAGTYGVMIQAGTASDACAWLEHEDDDVYPDGHAYALLGPFSLTGDLALRVNPAAGGALATAICTANCAAIVCGDGVVAGDEACDAGPGTVTTVDLAGGAALDGSYQTAGLDTYGVGQIFSVPAGGARLAAVRVVLVAQSPGACDDTALSVGLATADAGPVEAYGLGDVGVELADPGGDGEHELTVPFDLWLPEGDWSISFQDDGNDCAIRTTSGSSYATEAWALGYAGDYPDNEALGVDLAIALVLTTAGDDSCDRDCTAPVCGDGVVNVAAGEACDDGGTDDGDGCDGSCHLETAAHCVGEPSVCAVGCGNGFIDAGEACEPALAAGCTPECQAAVCGDGYLSRDAGELCEGGAFCDSVSCQPIACGDGVVGAGEECDGGSGFLLDPNPTPDAAGAIGSDVIAQTFTLAAGAEVGGVQLFIGGLNGGLGCDGATLALVGAPGGIPDTGAVVATTTLDGAGDTQGFFWAPLAISPPAALAAGQYAIVLTSRAGSDCMVPLQSAAYAGGELRFNPGFVAAAEKDGAFRVAGPDGGALATATCTAACESLVCGDGFVRGDEACDAGPGVTTTIDLAAGGAVNQSYQTSEDGELGFGQVFTVPAGGARLTEVRVGLTAGHPGGCDGPVIVVNPAGESGEPVLGNQSVVVASYELNDAADGAGDRDLTAPFDLFLAAGDWTIAFDDDGFDCAIRATGGSSYPTSAWLIKTADGRLASQDLGGDLAIALDLVSGGDASCDRDCTAPSCGDGVVNTAAGEACDDGGTEDGDGCSATCLLEAATYCAGEPSVCFTGCGNLVVDAGEDCDFYADPACNPDCTAAVCDDGFLNVDIGEVCDGGAFCDSVTCQPSICGDGVVNEAAGEACDAGPAFLIDPTPSPIRGSLLANAQLAQTFTLDTDTEVGAAYLYIGGTHGGLGCDGATLSLTGTFSDGRPDSDNVVASTTLDGAGTTQGYFWAPVVVDPPVVLPAGQYAITLFSRAGLDCLAPLQGEVYAGGVIRYKAGYNATANGDLAFRVAGPDGGALATASCSADCQAVVCGDGAATGTEACDAGAGTTYAIDASGGAALDARYPMDDAIAYAQTFATSDDGGLLTAVHLTLDAATAGACDGLYLGVGVATEDGEPTFAEAFHDDAGSVDDPDGVGVHVVTVTSEVWLGRGDRSLIVGTGGNPGCAIVGASAGTFGGSVWSIGAAPSFAPLAGDLAVTLDIAVAGSASCDSDCTPVVCGDGVVNIAAGEECDDGGTDDGDGCSASCAVEDGWVCGGAPSQCDEWCGDGVVEAWEECDPLFDTCDADCTAIVCGDGTRNLDAGELCEDGAFCDAAACVPFVCGDGVVNAGEDCDGGPAFLVDTNPAPSFTRGTLGNAIVSQTFTLDGAAEVAAVDVLVGSFFDTINCDGATVELTGTLSDGKPDAANVLASATLSNDTRGYAWVEVAFAPTVSLSAGTYAVRLRSDGGLGCQLVTGANPYAGGELTTGEPASGSGALDASVRLVGPAGGALATATCQSDCTEVAICGDGREQAGEACDPGPRDAVIDVIGDAATTVGPAPSEWRYVSQSFTVSETTTLESVDLYLTAPSVGGCIFTSAFIAPVGTDGAAGVELGAYGTSHAVVDVPAVAGVPEWTNLELGAVVTPGTWGITVYLNGACQALVSTADVYDGGRLGLANRAPNYAFEAHPEADLALRIHTRAEASTADCDLDCTVPECGDGVVNAEAGESCDDGGTADGDGCDGSCQVEAGSICINGG
ncbi:MAG: hypothetical protein KC635_13735, partial [Myxococcales bacterium]|nr:hypothetical protein [Myxococcales bacterium]